MRGVVAREGSEWVADIGKDLVKDQRWVQSMVEGRLVGFRVLPAEASGGGGAGKVPGSKTDGRRQETEQEVQDNDRIILPGED